MRIIEGYQAARAALTRSSAAGDYPISPALEQRLNQLFDTGDPELAVKRIISEVRQRGDAALFELTQRIDDVKLTTLEVAKESLAGARRELDESLIAALELAAERGESFHRAQRANLWREISGAEVGQVIRPLDRVGIYVPGGTAAYPSTVLMTAIPARVAGVGEVTLVTPPGKEGTVSPATLAAADIAGVDRVFSIGGAQAIAALAYGTESIPRVDKICGPGNIFVVLAKKLVYGAVAIDGLQGPSEVLIIADETASPEYCAADLLAQSEHDSMASVILVTTSPQLAHAVNREVSRQLAELTRRDIASEALNKGIIAIVDGIEAAIELANHYAPEHLCLMIKDAASYLDRVTNAGCVFVGAESTVALGDYIAGPSHVLPTGGTARFSSPLNIADFIKFTNTIAVNQASLDLLGPAASVLARAEGFDAHARAVEKRLKKD
jgi:histidinol dehydrogenase